MSNIAHPHPDPPPLRALRALQGRGKSAQQFEFVRMTGILNRLLDACVVTARSNESGGYAIANRLCNLFLHFLPCRAEDDFVHIDFFRLADGKEHAAGEARGGDFVGGVEVFHRAFGGC